ncbi:hypothetical protein MP638_001009 [Amoeboaphelidium occidentale]|nr:hypothetical protein MP638_001009 [Amoeboaphelidium occidentale]
MSSNSTTQQYDYEPDESDGEDYDILVADGLASSQIFYTDEAEIQSTENHGSCSNGRSSNSNSNSHSNGYTDHHIEKAVIRLSLEEEEDDYEYGRLDTDLAFQEDMFRREMCWRRGDWKWLQDVSLDQVLFIPSLNVYTTSDNPSDVKVHLESILRKHDVNKGIKFVHFIQKHRLLRCLPQYRWKYDEKPCLLILTHPSVRDKALKILNDLVKPKKAKSAGYALGAKAVGLTIEQCRHMIRPFMFPLFDNGLQTPSTLFFILLLSDDSAFESTRESSMPHRNDMKINIEWKASYTWYNQLKNDLCDTHVHVIVVNKNKELFGLAQLTRLTPTKDNAILNIGIRWMVRFQSVSSLSQLMDYIIAYYSSYMPGLRERLFVEIDSPLEDYVSRNLDSFDSKSVLFPLMYDVGDLLASNILYSGISMNIQDPTSVQVHEHVYNLQRFQLLSSSLASSSPMTPSSSNAALLTSPVNQVERGMKKPDREYVSVPSTPSHETQWFAWSSPSLSSMIPTTDSPSNEFDLDNSDSSNAGMLTDDFSISRDSPEIPINPSSKRINSTETDITGVHDRGGVWKKNWTVPEIVPAAVEEHWPKPGETK